MAILHNGVTTYRPLFCPICSARLSVPAEGKIPETYILPDHASANGMNICQGVVVKVTLDWAECATCGCNISKHPSGLCRACFGKKDATERKVMQK